MDVCDSRAGVGSRARLAHLAAALALLGVLTLTAASRANAYIYWTNDNSIGRANLDGSGVNQNFIAADNQGGAIAVDGTYIYWSTVYQAEQGAMGWIGRARVDGTAVNPNFIHVDGWATGLTVAGPYIYWAAGAYPDLDGVIGRAKLDGSAAQQAFITGASYPQGVAVSGAFIYWASSSQDVPWAPGFDAIGRANLDGSAANQTFMTDIGSPGEIAADGSYVYWPWGSRWIGRAKLDGTLRRRTFISEATNPIGVAVDGSHIYWANTELNTIGRANIDGSDPDTEYVDGASGSIAVDGGGPLGLGAPSISRLTQSAARWLPGNALAGLARAVDSVGTNFSFTLNRSARVRFAFTHVVSGRRVGGTCVAPTSANQGRPNCSRTVTAATLTFGAHAGRNRLHFEGRVGLRRRLAAGRYTLTLTASVDGLRSRPATLRFTILRP